MSRRNYWTSLRQRKISRRTMLGASAKAGVGAVGLALVGCGDDDDDAGTAAAERAAAAAEEAAAAAVAAGDARAADSEAAAAVAAGAADAAADAADAAGEASAAASAASAAAGEASAAASQAADAADAAAALAAEAAESEDAADAAAAAEAAAAAAADAAAAAGAAGDAAAAAVADAAAQAAEAAAQAAIDNAAEAAAAAAAAAGEASAAAEAAASTAAATAAAAVAAAEEAAEAAAETAAAAVAAAEEAADAAQEAAESAAMAAEEEEAEQADQGAVVANIGGNLRTGNHHNLGSLDPHVGISGIDAWYYAPMFDFLVMHDQQSVQRGDLSLAQTWEMPEDTQITFHLRDGVKFHNGESFTSEDVRLNLERVIDPELGATPKASFDVVERVDTPDPSTAIYRMSEPSVALMHLLGDRGGAMVHVPTAIEQGDDFGLGPVGTGPMRFVEWADGLAVSAERTGEHWMKGADGQTLSYYQDCNFNIVTESLAMIAAARSGDLDMVLIPEPQYVEEMEEDPNFNVLKKEGSGVFEVLAFNHGKEPTTDVNLRLAIAHSLDPEAANTAVHQGQQLVAKGGQWPPGTWVYQDVPNRPTYDPEKAREYLAKSDYDPDQDGPILMVSYPEPQKVQAGQLYQDQIQRTLGIEVIFDVLEVVQWIPAFFIDNKYHMGLTGWSLWPEPDLMASLAFGADGTYNPAKASDPRVEELVVRGRSVTDVEERKAIYTDLNEIIVGEAFFHTLIYHVQFTAAHVSIQNTDTLYNGEAKWQTRRLWTEAV